MLEEKISITLKKLPDSEVEIEAELPATLFDAFWSKALKNLGENANLAGFRPGHIPEKILIENIGEAKVLTEMAELAIGEYYPKILEENKIDALGQPEVTITKLAKNNPLGFKLKTAILPEVNLPDYRKIATTINAEPIDDSAVKDEEVEKIIEDIRQERAHHRYHEEHSDEKEHDHSKELPLPALNDEFAKTIGNFATLTELQAKIKENLGKEKELKAKDKKRLKIIDTLCEKTTISLPKILIDSAKNKMLAEMEGQISQIGLKFDDYLAHLKKTREELMAGWDDDAKKRATVDLLLREIARAEKIEAPTEELKEQVDWLAEQHKDIERYRLEAYAINYLITTHTLEFLENLK